MKSTLLFAVIILLMTNCTHRIVRSGYQIDDSGYTASEIHIKKEVSIPDSVANKIGEIKLGESGFSTSCSEEQAINILRSEALELNADLIIITNEVRPNAWSTCYRCNAKFYRFYKADYAATYTTDPEYHYLKVDNRVTNDHQQNTLIIFGSITLGILLGLLLVV